MSNETESNMAELQRVARQAVEGARTRGASGARARAAASRSVSLTYRDRRPEQIQESARSRLSLSLYVDGRYTVCDTNHLEEEALAAFLDDAVALARAVAVDEDRQLPDPELYVGHDGERDLALFDDSMSRITPAERHRYASALESAVNDLADADTTVLSVEAKYQDSQEELYQVCSNGFEGEYRSTQVWGFADVTLADSGDRKPSGWGVAGSHRWGELIEPEAVAREALASARARLGSQAIETARLPVIVEARTVGRLLRHLLAAVDGRAIQQRASFLEGQLGEQIGSALLDVRDEPWVAGGFGSRTFDSEGIVSRPMPLFEKGRLSNYYLDTYYARKLGESPTTGAASNIVITPGDASPAELLKGIERGVLVRGFLGGNSNTTTGDFSLGVYGTLIENGALAGNLSEMNIAGNHRSLWQQLSAVGNDLYPFSTIRSPSLRFDGVQLSGR